MSIKNETIPTVCLNMIVKNESKIIRRLLESVYILLDSYCICDTGSTDDTCEIITSFFKEKHINGKIVKEPFKNFEYNRNFALKSALGMSDFLLLLDADMQPILKNFNKNFLSTGDAFLLFQGNLTFYYQNVRIIRNNTDFRYFGVTHEFLNVPDNYKKVIIDKEIFFINDIGDGCCKKDKYERDIKLLTDYLIIDPNHDRSLFYLGNTYFDTNQNDKAIETYKKRIQIGGWVEEIFYSYYRMGCCYEKKKDYGNAIYSWLEGFNHHNDRLESMYKIINYYRNNGKNKIAYNFFIMILETLKKHKNGELYKDGFLFLESDVYTYLLEYEYSIIAYYLNIKNINNEIITIFNNCYDGNNINNLLINMKFYNNVLKVPNITYNFNNKIKHKINGKFYDFTSSSSSIIQNGSNGYFMNIRYVNYELINDYKSYKYDNYILTINEYVSLDRNFDVIERKLFNEIFHDGRQYGGVEDVRLFLDKEKNKIVFVGVGLHQNNNIGIMYGDYDITNDYLKPNELVSLFSNNGCEKNWVYCNYKNEIHMIYSWNPLRLCKINTEKNCIICINSIDMPLLFKYIRGSSCGYSYNDEIWFIVHLVSSSESPRHYYHLICVFDENMKLLRYTAPFKFINVCIEYSLGIIVEQKKVLITNSQHDSTTNISVYSKNYIEEILKYTN